VAEKGRPWMRWHVTRWRNSPRVLQMSLAAQGAYRNLLDAAWQLGCRLPNLPELMWKYALAQSPQEFAALAAQVMPMFSATEDGLWLTNETLTEECAGRAEFAEELSRKRSAAGKKGNATRWGEKPQCPQGCGEATREQYACELCAFQGCLGCLTRHQREAHEQIAAQASQTGSQSQSQNDRKPVANPDLRSPNVLPARDLVANTSHKREEKRVEEKIREPTPAKAESTIDVAQWKCVELGLASPRWTRPPEALCAFEAALKNEQRASPEKALTDLADELGSLWLEYTRSRKGSGEYAMGPTKFFGEAWFRRTAAWRDAQPVEPSSTVDGSDFIAEKRKKRAAATQTSPLMDADNTDQNRSA
jgi:uncharacterized protein YdaU (DUF1376 family)